VKDKDFEIYLAEMDKAWKIIAIYTANLFLEKNKEKKNK